MHVVPQPRVPFWIDVHVPIDHDEIEVALGGQQEADRRRVAGLKSQRLDEPGNLLLTEEVAVPASADRVGTYEWSVRSGGCGTASPSTRRCL